MEGNKGSRRRADVYDGEGAMAAGRKWDAGSKHKKRERQEQKLFLCQESNGERRGDLHISVDHFQSEASFFLNGSSSPEDLKALPRGALALKEYKNSAMIQSRSPAKQATMRQQ